MRTYTHSVTVELPGGVADGDSAITSIELRPLTGREEEWLAENTSAPAAVAVSTLLEACILQPQPNLIPKLLAGDRDYLILQLRRITIGDNVQAVIDCPNCSAKMDVDFRVSDVVVERRPQTAESYEVRLPERVLRFRLPNGTDQEFVAWLAISDAVEVLLERCVFNAKGLSAEERAAVISAMEEVAPRVDLELDLACPECGHQSVLPFDTTSFFIREMTGRRQQLLREVHSLALHYHWSEAEILSMVRSRRRTYLELLSDAMRH